MSTRSRRPGRSRPTEPAPPFADAALAELGLRAGDAVRFRKNESGHWTPAVVVRRERDGSLGLSDGKGASRSIPLEHVQVRATGKRGGTVWEPLLDRAGRTEQMKLL